MACVQIQVMTYPGGHLKPADSWLSACQCKKSEMSSYWTLYGCLEQVIIWIMKMRKKKKKVWQKGEKFFLVDVVMCFQTKPS